MDEKKRNLYEVLGLDEDATEEEIQQAFRKRAQETHPDREGGDKDEFIRVRQAYGILSDKSRRKNYDRTGSEKQLNEQLRTRAMQEVAAFTLQLLDDESFQMDFDNLVDKIVKSFQRNIKEQEKKIELLEKVIAKRRKIVERIKLKNKRKIKDDFIRKVVLDDIKEQEESIDRAKENINLAKESIVVINEYEYLVPIDPDEFSKDKETGLTLRDMTRLLGKAKPSVEEEEEFNLDD